MSQEEIVEGLRKSKARLRPLYPTLIEKGTMNILDGKGRKQADPAWPEQEVEIKDPKDRVLIPLHANYRRQVSKKETQTYLLTLADMLEQEGVQPKEIVSKITELTPFTERYVRKLLPKKYKMAQMARQPKKIAELVPQIKPTPIAAEGLSPFTAPVGKPPGPPQAARCPTCGAEIETVLCSRCLKEVPLKKLKEAA